MTRAVVRMAAAAGEALVRTGAVAAPTGTMIDAMLKTEVPAAAAGSVDHWSQAIRPLPALSRVSWPRRRKSPTGPGMFMISGVVIGPAVARPTASMPRLDQAAPYASPLNHSPVCGL